MDNIIWTGCGKRSSTWIIGYNNSKSHQIISHLAGDNIKKNCFIILMFHFISYIYLSLKVISRRF